MGTGGGGGGSTDNRRQNIQGALAQQAFSPGEDDANKKEGDQHRGWWYFKKGHTLFLLENWDVITTKGEGRHKVDRLKKPVRKLEVDGLVGTEVIVNRAKSSIEEKL